MEKLPFFRADMAGLGKYHMGGYGRIGVYRVKVHIYRHCVKTVSGKMTPSGKTHFFYHLVPP